jgi:acetoin:2,6-dichlorophenolindophenol oxidoreductase subunit beta
VAEQQTREMTFVGALNLAMDQALAADPKVILLGEDIADPSGGILGATTGLSTKYGDERVRDTPISEAAIVGAAVGAGLAGYRPVAEIMIMDFIGIAIDQIVNHAAKMRFMTAGRLTSPITVRTASLGGHGTGATHSQSLEAWFTHIPGLKVAVPATPADAKGLLTTAICDDDPVVFVETGSLYGSRGPVPVDDSFSIPFGQAEICREGGDVTLVTYGRGVRESLAAAAALEAEGISVEVINLRTLVPLDMPTVLDSVAKTGRAVVAHMATRFSGFGAEVAATIHEELFGQLAAPVARVGATYTPIPQAKPIETAALPQPSDIADAVRRTMSSAAAMSAN